MALADGFSLPAADRAFEFQRERAEGRGQRWSPAHAAALHSLHCSYVLTADSLSPARTAWPLAVGAGKSESIVALVATQYAEHLADRPSLTVLVCMERVEQLSELYRSILATGVPSDFVGIHHTVSAKEVAAEGYVGPTPVAEASNYRVLLATHGKMLKGAHNIALVNTFGSADRDLVIWDESLIKARGVSVDLESMEAASAFFGVLSKGNADATAAHAFFTERLTAMRQAFEAGSADTLAAPEVSPDDEFRFSSGVASALRKGKLAAPMREMLAEFMDHLQRPVRVLQYTDQGQKLGLIYFDTLIPPTLKRLVVLDASHNIRLLTSKHDTELTVTSTDCAVKSFEDVAVKTLKVAAGRDALDRSLPRGDSAVMREIVEEVSSWPKEHKGLIVTFRLRGAEARRGRAAHADYIRQALKGAGIDVDGRVSFLTWGAHTGVNTFKEAHQVLLVGVLRRDEFELSSAIAGQQGKLDSPAVADLEEIRRVTLSEMFHNVVQAAGRGRCRHTVDGKALPMSLAVICNEEFPAPWWQAAMPGVVVKPWKGKHAVKHIRKDERVGAVEEALRKVPESVDKVSTYTLRRLAGLASVPSDAFAHLLKKVTALGWCKDGRSFVRESPFFIDEPAA